MSFISLFLLAAIKALVRPSPIMPDRNDATGEHPRIASQLFHVRIFLKQKAYIADRRKRGRIAVTARCSMDSILFALRRALLISVEFHGEI